MINRSEAAKSEKGDREIKPRAYPLDGARGIAIVAVVFGHVWRGVERAGLMERGAVFEAVDGAIYIWHMPLFFFVSGCLFRPSCSVGFGLWRRAVTLLPAMVLWSWIDAAMRYVAGGNANDAIGDWQQILMAPFPPHGIYWFLLALFLIQGASEILGQIFPAKWRNQVLILAGALSLLLFPFGQGTVFEAALHNFPFFVAGALMDAPMLSLSKRPIVIGTLFLGVMALGAALALGTSVIPQEHLVVVLLGVAGSFLLVRFVDSMGECAYLAYLGRNTLPIYLTHVIFVAIIRTVLLRLGGEQLVILILLLTVFGLVLPLLLVAGLRRLSLSRYALLDPPMLGRARGELGK